VSVKILVDMNLSPEWAPLLSGHGWEAIHWSTVGDPRAPDSVITAWARAKGYVVFTHDLDFGAALALTHAAGPSVLQLRGQHILPEVASPLVVAVLRRYEPELQAGALVVIEGNRSRVRVLPL
jgi:predicted nuclease of predicted toxin-antitoxin system